MIGRHVRAGAALHADDYHRPRCSRPAWERPKPDGSGLSFATSGPGARWCHRRRLPSLPRRIAWASMQRRCLAPAGSFLHADGYAGVRRLYSTNHAQWRADAGRGCMLEPRTPKVLRGAPSCHSARRSPWRPWSGSPPCSPSKAASADGHPISVAPPRAKSTPGRRLCKLKTFLDTSLNRVSGKSALAQATSKSPVALAGADPIRPTDSRLGNVEQRRRAGNGSHRCSEGKLSVLRLRRRCGQRAACIYTTIETAKMCGINPQAHLADVLNRIADHPIRQIDTLCSPGDGQNSA